MGRFVSGDVHKHFSGFHVRIQQSSLQYSAFFALGQLHEDFVKFQSAIFWNVLSSQEWSFCLITTSKNNLSEIRISRPRGPRMPYLSHYSILVKTEPHCHTRLTGAPNDGFFLNALKSLFSLFQCTFGYLEMHSKRRCKICFLFPSS